MSHKLSFKFALALAACVTVSAPAMANVPPEQTVVKPLVHRLVYGQPVLAPLAHVRFCMMNPSECASGFMPAEDSVQMTETAMADLVAVNNRVNEAILPQMKIAPNIFGAAWNIAPDAGDCNDYAVTKRHALLEMGWPPSSVLLASVKTARGEGHLVVIVKTDKGDLVLDNLSETIRPVAHVRYQWLAMQSSGDPRMWHSVARRLV